MTLVGPGRAGHLIALIAGRLGENRLQHAEPGPLEDRIVVAREHVAAVLAFCRRDPDADLDLLVDESCIDYGLGAGRARFDVLLRLRSSRLGYRLLVTVPLPDDDPSFPSATAHYAAADWLEREIHDLFGVFPDGHPYVRRLLLYPGFAGHPLRRDYPAEKDQPLIALKRLGPGAVVIDADGNVVEEPGP